MNKDEGTLEEKMADLISGAGFAQAGLELALLAVMLAIAFGTTLLARRKGVGATERAKAHRPARSARLAHAA
jgi:hypothetical protein